jgi:hypothetical protein
MGKRNYEKFIGYTIYNPTNFEGKSCIADDGEVYFYLKDARKECKRLTRDFENPTLEVVRMERVDV